MLKFLKKKAKDQQPNSQRYFKVKIREVIRKTEDASTLVFEKNEKLQDKD